MENKLIDFLTNNINSNDDESIADTYDNVALKFHNKNIPKPYLNFGFWDSNVDTHIQASNALMKLIVEGVSKFSKSEEQKQKVLDVGCGLGMTTKFLSKIWDPENVYGINLTKAQIEVCKSTAEGCQFSVMDASKLSFDDNYFNNVICIEAAFQFHTREDFFIEVFRVLKKGGVLSLTDVLLKPEGHSESHRFSSHYPSFNYLASIASYQNILTNIGFEVCSISDITREGSSSSCLQLMNTYYRTWSAGGISFQVFQENLSIIYLLDCIININLLCFARKPLN